MKKRGFKKFVLIVLTVITMLVVLYMVFPDRIKALYIISAMKCKNDKIREILKKPIEKYSNSLFFRPLIMLTGSKDPDIANSSFGVTVHPPIKKIIFF